MKQDHREAAALLKAPANGKPSATRRKATAKLVAALTLHMAIEEELRHPLIAKRVNKEDAHEGTIEHGLARDGLAKMTELVDEPGYGATVARVTAGRPLHVGPRYCHASWVGC